jgi:hypothetical protein
MAITTRSSIRVNAPHREAVVSIFLFFIVPILQFKTDPPHARRFAFQLKACWFVLPAAQMGWIVI